MNLDSEDPRLTAYLLGELSTEETAAIKHAVAADPALRLAVRELENTQRLLTNSLAPESKSLLPSQRDKILSAARHADQSGTLKPLASPKRTLKPLMVPLAAAAIITVAILLLLKLPTAPRESTRQQSPDPPPPDSVALEIALLPAPGPPGPTSSAAPGARPTASSNLAKNVAARSSAMEKNSGQFLRDVAKRLAGTPPPDAAMLPPLATRTPVPTTSQTSLALPVHSGRSSLPWITHSIRKSRKLPPPAAVRLEEILNEFKLRPGGPAAISKGVTLSTEAVQCPWKPSATLLLVSFRGAKNAAREISAEFQTAPSKVRRFRLLGFAPIPGVDPAPLPSHLPAGLINSVMIEIEPVPSSVDLGQITWSVNGQPAPSVSLAPTGNQTASEDVRFAALVCTFAQWLSKRPAGLIDDGLLSALARESAASNLPAARADFLNLIDQSLNR